MTTSEAAQALGITPRRVLWLIKAGRLIAVKHGWGWWIEPVALDAVKVRTNGRPKKK